jgi:hypothetical protein
MKITAKVRFGATKSKVESFGMNRYLVYLLSEQTDTDALDEFMALMSRALGVPSGKIEYVGKDSNGDRVFEI